DLLVQAYSGIARAAGTVESPAQPAPVFVVDVATAHLATQAVLASLWRVLRTGDAVEAKVSMLRAALELQTMELSAFASAGLRRAPGKAPYASLYMDPPYGIYRVADGAVALARARLDVVATVIGDAELAELAGAR